MPRVPLIDQRDQAAETQLDVFDHIAASRDGRVGRPFAVMLHRPELARATADLGAVIRFESTLPDHDRELAIVTTASERGCRFEWEAHRPLALAAGVAVETLDAIDEGSPVSDVDDAGIVELVRMLCGPGNPEPVALDAALSRFGPEAFVELVSVVGYYSMLAVVMTACDVC